MISFSSADSHPSAAPFPMTAASGIVAALAAPLVLDIGFIIWDKHWKGSSFALNLYKCSLASIGFLILSLVTRPPAIQDAGPFPSDIFTVQSVGFLMLSSTIGILVGDWTWLEALQLIGAKRVVLMDSIKPFLAALFGWMILGERLAWPAFVGMALTVLGVIWVSLEREKPADAESEDENETEGKDDECDNNSNEEGNVRSSSKSSDKFEDDALPASEENMDIENAARSNLQSADISNDTTTQTQKQKDRIRQRRKGFLMAIANVFLDTYGSLLTKQYGVGMSTWNISLIRFGFAAAFCITLSSLLHLRDIMAMGYDDLKGNAIKSPPPGEEGAGRDSLRRSSLRGSVLQLLKYRLGKDIEAQTEGVETASAAEQQRKRPWYSLPKMKCKSWLKISLGVAFTTFACPALSNYALFQIALALALTLMSIGPIYMVPLSWLFKNERPSVRSCLGSLLAVAGVAILSFFGR